MDNVLVNGTLIARAVVVVNDEVGSGIVARRADTQLRS